MSILLDVGIGLEINVLTSKFILLGNQMLGEMGCHPEICFYTKRHSKFNGFWVSFFKKFQIIIQIYQILCHFMDKTVIK